MGAMFLSVQSREGGQVEWRTSMHGSSRMGWELPTGTYVHVWGRSAEGISQSGPEHHLSHELPSSFESLCFSFPGSTPRPTLALKIRPMTGTLASGKAASKSPVNGENRTREGLRAPTEALILMDGDRKLGRRLWLPNAQSSRQ